MAMNAPLQAAATNVTRAAQALNASATANAALASGQNVVSNMNRAIAANTKAANQLAMGAQNASQAAALETNRVNKAKLNMARKHLTIAAINAASNRPVNAANAARRGLNSLKNYIRGNL